MVTDALGKPPAEYIEFGIIAQPDTPLLRLPAEPGRVLVVPFCGEVFSGCSGAGYWRNCVRISLRSYGFRASDLPRPEAIIYLPFVLLTGISQALRNRYASCWRVTFRDLSTPQNQITTAR